MIIIEHTYLVNIDFKHHFVTIINHNMHKLFVTTIITTTSELEKKNN